MINRRPLMTHELPTHTPWGKADSGTEYGEGVISVGTPGHGGFLLNKERNQQVHKAWRNENRAYEEDSDWAIVAATFPDLFDDRERELADKSLRNWLPDAYKQVTGKDVDPEESYMLRKRLQDEENKDKWVVISAEGRGDLVRATAALGGNRNSTERRTFMVERSEYKVTEGGFVIDPARHREILA